jgi:23S rRNA pseudouridine1911/1915/1917 synthase
VIGDDLDADDHRVIVTDEQAGERIDAVLATAIATLSRAVVQRLIDDDHVTINALPVKKPGQRVKLGDVIDVEIPAPEPIELVPEDIPLAIVFEDSEIIVIDKPAGLVVHPAAGHPRGTLVNAILFHCKDLGGIGGVLRPGIVHRLDKDTSGVMVVAKTDRAHASLTAAFAAKSHGARERDAVPGNMKREYLGIAAPPPPAASGTLRTFHGRHPSDRKKFSSRIMWGKNAVTHWTVEEPLAEAALVRFRLETGRTHQIRVHAADHGWPLLGDQLYGRAPPKLAPIAKALGRQALHAAVLELDHPTTNEHMKFTSPLPADMTTALAALR